METKNAGYTLIIAEDNKSIRESMIEHFKNSEQFAVLDACGDGASALLSIEKKQPQIVLLDIVLSTLDGFELLEKIKDDEELKNKPKMLVLSSLCNEGFAQKAIDFGASYYMIKPINFDVLDKRLLEVMNDFKTAGKAVEAAHADVLRGNIHIMPAVRSGKNRALDERISNIFITVGIPAHIKGYQFLREAIKMAIQNPEIINSITKQLYPSIADRFETSASKVERAIRHAIEVAWNRGKIENINNVFGIKVYTSNDKPTNGEFIALVADKMLIEGA